MRIYSKILRCIFFAIFLSCKTPESTQAQDLIYHSDHFIIHYTEYDKSHLTTISDTLESAYARITKDLAVKKMDLVHVYFYRDYPTLKAAVKNDVPDLPEWASGLATSARALHMISPFRNNASNLIILIHEFAHCVTLSINPRFGNNPRWLWESIALYQARDAYQPTKYIFLDQTPTPLSNLNNIQNTRIYELGYYLAEFIIHKWGWGKMVELIRVSGNIEAVLGINEIEFRYQWTLFFNKQYQI